MPGQSRLFLDFCAGSLRAFLPLDEIAQAPPPRPPHWPELVHLVAEQNPSATAEDSLAALAEGAGAILTGQQVGLFGGPLYTPLKAATAIARARKSTTAGHPHAAIFWLATEDHDFAEVDHVTFPAGRELATLTYGKAPESAIPAGSIVFDESISPLVERAAELLGPSESTEALVAAYKPGRTFAQAFGDFYSALFSAQGLLIVDAAGRDFHRLGAPVLRAAIERADEFHAALTERGQALEAAGYHVQVAVAPQSSLLFLIDAKSGARIALSRTAPTPAEPNGLWHADHQAYSTADLLGILDSEPERISPSALLRPVFQDFLLRDIAALAAPPKSLTSLSPLSSSSAFSATKPRHRPLLRNSHRAVHRRALAQTRSHLLNRCLPRRMRERSPCASPPDPCPSKPNRNWPPPATRSMRN